MPNANYSDSQTIHGRAQCTPDIKELECTECLGVAISDIPTCCNGKVGGRVVRPSCNIRYDVQLFYNDSTTNRVDAPPPSPSPTATSPLTPSTNTTNAQGNLTSFLLLLCILSLFFRFNKFGHYIYFFKSNISFGQYDKTLLVY